MVVYNICLHTTCLHILHVCINLYISLQRYIHILTLIHIYIHTLTSIHRAMESSEEAQLSEDLCCALYNNAFSQVILVKSLGTVKVYEAEVGMLLLCML